MALLIMDESLGEHNSEIRRAMAGAVGCPTCYVARYMVCLGSSGEERGPCMMKLLDFINHNLRGVVYMWTRSNDHVIIAVADTADEFTMDMSKAGGIEHVYKALPGLNAKQAGWLRTEPAWGSYEAL